MDVKYGGKLHSWDQEKHTVDEFVDLLKQFDATTTCSFYVTMIWCAAEDVKTVCDALRATQHNNIQHLYWHKLDHNQARPQHCLIPCLECGVIAYHGVANNFSTRFNLPASIHERHNVVIGPGQRAYDRDANQEIVNKCQKPAYLSEWFASKFCSQGSTVLVAGAGAGGDVRGFMNHDLNVVAIEQEERQWTATCANLRAHKPAGDLTMIFTYGDFRERLMQKDQIDIGVDAHRCDKCPAPAEGAAYKFVAMCMECGAHLCNEHWPNSANSACPVCSVPHAQPVEKVD